MPISSLFAPPVTVRYPHRRKLVCHFTRKLAIFKNESSLLGASFFSGKHHKQCQTADSSLGLLFIIKEVSTPVPIKAQQKTCRNVLRITEETKKLELHLLIYTYHINFMLFAIVISKEYDRLNLHSRETHMHPNHWFGFPSYLKKSKPKTFVS